MNSLANAFLQADTARKRVMDMDKAIILGEESVEKVRDASFVGLDPIDLCPYKEGTELRKFFTVGIYRAELSRKK